MNAIPYSIHPFLEFVYQKISVGSEENRSVPAAAAVAPRHFPSFLLSLPHMELNSKQRKLLEKAAQPLSPLVIVGQDGVTDGVSSMLSSQLESMSSSN